MFTSFRCELSELWIIKVADKKKSKNKCVIRADSTRVIIYALTQRYFNWIKIVKFFNHFFVIHVRFQFCFLIDITNRYIYYERMIIALFAAI